MKLLLSSRTTPLFKFAIPGLFLSLIVTHLLIIPSAGGLPSNILVVVFISVVLWKLSSPLKRVVIAGDHLYVSNYFSEYRVPLAAIKKVDLDPFPYGAVVIARVYYERENSREEIVRFIIAVLHATDEATEERLLHPLQTELRLIPQDDSQESLQRERISGEQHIRAESLDDNSFWYYVTAFTGGAAVLIPLVTISASNDIKSVLFFAFSILVGGGLVALALIFFVLYLLYFFVGAIFSAEPGRRLITLAVELGESGKYDHLGKVERKERLDRDTNTLIAILQTDSERFLAQLYLLGVGGIMLGLGLFFLGIGWIMAQFSGPIFFGTIMGHSSLPLVDLKDFVQAPSGDIYCDTFYGSISRYDGDGNFIGRYPHPTFAKDSRLAVSQSSKLYFLAANTVHEVSDSLEVKNEFKNYARRRTWELGPGEIPQYASQREGEIRSYRPVKIGELLFSDASEAQQQEFHTESGDRLVRSGQALIRYNAAGQQTARIGGSKLAEVLYSRSIVSPLCTFFLFLVFVSYSTKKYADSRIPWNIK